MAQRQATEAGEGRQSANWFDRMREVCARSLGVRPEHKEELYIEILKSASLRDVSYWLQLPAHARIVDHELTTSANAPLGLRISSLSPREISPDAQTLIAGEVRSRLAYPNARVEFACLTSEYELLAFPCNQATVTDAFGTQLERLAAALLRHPALSLEIVAGSERHENPELARARTEAVAAYLFERWQIPATRTRQATSEDAGRNLALRLTLPGTSTKEPVGVEQ